jgi:hypothetical protein
MPIKSAAEVVDLMAVQAQTIPELEIRAFDDNAVEML